jgi:hypothetical protein
MTNNALKSTIATILATDALIVVTLEGTFNSKTGSPVLSSRTRVDQQNKFLRDYCERVSAEQATEAQAQLEAQVEQAAKKAQNSLNAGEYAAAAKYAQEAHEMNESIGEPRMYYRVKANADLRSVTEKRAEKKAQNAAKRAEKSADRAAKLAEKMAAKVGDAAHQNIVAPPASGIVQPPAAKTAKAVKKAA